MYLADPFFDENARLLYNNWACEYPISIQKTEFEMGLIEKHILKYLSKEAHILDIVCGKGEILQKLILKGYQVTGLDISDEMLRYAHQNAPSGKFIRDDICFFKSPPTFHAVVSTYNVFSYILSLEDLTKAFYNVFSALLENGLFGFDLTEGLIVPDDGSSIQDDFLGHIEDDYTWIQRSSNSQDGKSSEIKSVTFKLLNGNWQRSDANFAQRDYSREEVQSALEKVGFRKITLYDMTKDFPMKDSRILYVFRKS